MSEKLIEAFTDLDEEVVLKIIREMLESGTDPMTIVNMLKDAMELIGKRFEKGDAFIPDLILSGKIMEQVLAYIKPKLNKEMTEKRLGTFLIGSVAGDIHDIGKNIVTSIFSVNGFDVIDLGVDVQPDVFVEKIREIKPDIVGMSGLLTLAFDAMKLTVEVISEAGLRDTVKIIIGGGPIDEKVCLYTGADAWANDVIKGVSQAKQWVAGK
jgi:methanogenic corrinoid protein MtbC1